MIKIFWNGLLRVDDHDIALQANQKTAEEEERGEENKSRYHQIMIVAYLLFSHPLLHLHLCIFSSYPTCTRNESKAVIISLI